MFEKITLQAPVICMFYDLTQSIRELNHEMNVKKSKTKAF